MPNSSSENNESKFEKEFKEHFLKIGFGSMAKSDVDALVMHLADKYWLAENEKKFGELGNQRTSELLKVPVAKVRKLRYDAALKFGNEDEAQGRFLGALSNASLATDGKKIQLLIEDLFAKNWLQGKLKEKKQISDSSFNAEIVKVSPDGLFEVLEDIFQVSEKGSSLVADFKAEFEDMKKTEDANERNQKMKEIFHGFTVGAAKAAGAGVATFFKMATGAVF